MANAKSRFHKYMLSYCLPNFQGKRKYEPNSSCPLSMVASWGTSSQAAAPQ